MYSIWSVLCRHINTPLGWCTKRNFKMLSSFVVATFHAVNYSIIQYTHYNKQFKLVNFSYDSMKLPK